MDKKGSIKVDHNLVVLGVGVIWIGFWWWRVLKGLWSYNKVVNESEGDTFFEWGGETQAEGLAFRREVEF